MRVATAILRLFCPLITLIAFRAAFGTEGIVRIQCTSTFGTKLHTFLYSLFLAPDNRLNCFCHKYCERLDWGMALKFRYGRQPPTLGEGESCRIEIPERTEITSTTLKFQAFSLNAVSNAANVASSKSVRLGFVGPQPGPGR